MTSTAWPMVATTLIAALPAAAERPTPPPPNIIFILADDMGHADLGCYGQRLIRTPRMDQMAKEGIRFTAAYCGTSVCAPSRCALMTGKHIGHAAIRANRELPGEGQLPLPENTWTVAKQLKEAGYATACVGKWGLGFVGTSGDPLKNGFDHFFGYNCQRQAHTYYPDHLWRDDRRVELDGKTYSHDLMTQEALDWVRAHKDGPFFLYLPYTAPHEKIAVPELEPYTKDQPWSEHEKVYASLISRMDRDVGRLLDLLRELKLDERTLVIFASDNGQDNPVRARFHCNGGLRGEKRTMYEGGLRAPFIARWPGAIPPGTTNATPVAFYDFLPTVADLIGKKIPETAAVDGLSFKPALLGQPMPEREYLYWELHEAGFIQAVRMGAWKGVRNGPQMPVELYDLKTDRTEARNVAAEHPEVVRNIEALLKTAHIPNPLWPDR